eukprot:s253_g22.t1
MTRAISQSQERAATVMEKDDAATATVTPPPVQSLRFLRTFGTENEAKPGSVPDATTESAVPGQVLPSAEPEVDPPGDVQSQGQGPPPQKAAPTPPAEKDLQWQRHQQHLAYLKSLGSEAYRMAVDDTEGLSPAPVKESEVDDTTCTPSQRGPELLQCLSVDVKHLFEDTYNYTWETSMVEKHLDEAMAVVSPTQEEKQLASPRPLTTPGRGVREVLKSTPSSVENWSQEEDREIWDKLKAQLQSLEDSVGELTRKTMPKPRPTLEQTQYHPWPKDAGMAGFFQGFRTSIPVGQMAPVVSHVSRDTLSEHSSSDVSSSNAKGHSSMASVQSQQRAEQGSMEPEAMRDGRCVQLSCRSRSSNSLASAGQLPTPCSAKIMAPVEVLRTPSTGARTPAISPGRSLVYRQISSPVALLTPRIPGEVRTIMGPGGPAGYPQ